MTHTTPEARLESVIISPAASIGEAIARLDKAGTGALALCSGNRKLVGVLTDGDIRRAMLRVPALDDPCGSICSLEPIAALQPVAPAEALRLMNQHDINHLPVVDGDGVLHDLILRRDLGTKVELEATAQLRLESAVISPTASIAEAIALLDKAGTGALVLCTNDRILCGLLTDGDIRRAILQGKSMAAPCNTIASRKPMVAPRSISPGEALDLMNQHDINHLPVVDANEPRSGVFVAQGLGSGSTRGPFGRDHGRRIRKTAAPADGKCSKTHAAGGRPSLVGTNHSTAAPLRYPRCKPDHALSSGIHSEAFWGWRRLRGQIELFEGSSPHGHGGRTEADEKA